MELIKYNTPAEFIAVSREFLYQDEITNILIIGLCNSFPEKNKTYSSANLLCVIDHDEVIGVAMNTIPNIIISTKRQPVEALRLIYNYYESNNIQYKSVFSSQVNTLEYLKISYRKVENYKKIWLHRLDKINHIYLTNGEMQLATEHDIDWLVEWNFAFNNDIENVIKQTPAQIKEGHIIRIGNKNTFKWMVDNKPTAMCVNVRESDGFFFIGGVYTPDALRGRGYATALVKVASEYLMSTKNKKGGLYTDASNPISNKIYQRIGYEFVEEHVTMIFDQK